jgi:hypothetical protein
MEHTTCKCRVDRNGGTERTDISHRPPMKAGSQKPIPIQNIPKHNNWKGEKLTTATSVGGYHFAIGRVVEL